ncbi:hypothetical protein [uncultured Desulfovibrio sp.]|uniref:hypothetical protein n=2 Tax=uncultured Desulfovibrio sp. TaxID=167968 RepID=UPI00261C9ADC|nr:hypothetical protein [uncultured Desulfovibrio sp.]
MKSDKCSCEPLCVTYGCGNRAAGDTMQPFTAQIHKGFATAQPGSFVKKHVFHEQSCKNPSQYLTAFREDKKRVFLQQLFMNATPSPLLVGACPLTTRRLA